jgi:hypothetical protein
MANLYSVFGYYSASLPLFKGARGMFSMEFMLLMLDSRKGEKENIPLKSPFKRGRLRYGSLK